MLQCFYKEKKYLTTLVTQTLTAIITSMFHNHKQIRQSVLGISEGHQKGIDKQDKTEVNFFYVHTFHPYLGIM